MNNKIKLCICVDCKEPITKEVRYVIKWDKSSGTLCTKCHMRRYNEEHIEEKRAKGREYSRKHGKEHRKKNRKYMQKYLKKYIEDHLEELKIYRKEYWRKWYIENRQKSLKISEEYRKSHKKERNKKLIEKRKTDIQFKLASYLRSRLNGAIKNNQKKGSAVKDLGCTIKFLKEYIESKFLPGMSWSNWGRGSDKWHIDHILPLDSFDLANRKQFKQAVHYTNLQPLWEPDNLRKSNRII